jgi:phospholipid/cholesterol/gamma-HCH transport system substrate-binding protein
MKTSIEVRAAIIGVLTILALIWGINFLKGRNVLSSTYTLHVAYSESGGLEKSSSVLLRGMKIGYVDDLKLKLGEENPVHASLRIDSDYPIGAGAVALLSSTDLLGTKAIIIEGGGEEPGFQHNDTIPGLLEADLLARLEKKAFPLIEQVETLAVSLDSLSASLNLLLSSEELDALLSDLSGFSRSLRESMEEGGSLASTLNNLDTFSATLAGQQENLADFVSHIKQVSADLDHAELDSVALELQQLAGQMNTLVAQVNSGEGSAGKFFYSDSLYSNLDRLLRDLDSLVVDLRKNPQDYVQISVFGKSGKK